MTRGAERHEVLVNYIPIYFLSPSLDVPTREQHLLDQSSPQAQFDPYRKPLPRLPLPPQRDSAQDLAKPKLIIKPKPNPRPRTPGFGHKRSKSDPHCKPGSSHQDSAQYSGPQRSISLIKPKPNPRPRTLVPPVSGPQRSVSLIKPKPNPRPRTLGAPGSSCVRSVSFSCSHSKASPILKPSSEIENQSLLSDRKISVDDLRKGRTSIVSQRNLQDELTKKLERRRMKDSVSVRE